MDQKFNHKTVMLSAALVLGAPSVLAGENCNVLDIPQCIGWKVVCPSHAPDFELEFDDTGLKISHLTGANFNTISVVNSSFASLTSTQGGLPVTTFTTPSGLGGAITALQHPTCSDGHFFGNAPFSLSITSVGNGINIANGATACCVLQPH